MDHMNNSCCCGEAEYFSGCLICGAPITYRAESSIQTCSICHKEQLTNAVCENGHFICDACHSYGTYAPVITTLRDSTEKDALLLLEKIMDLPSVHMHGPEHHAIVPCVLLTAFRNNGEHMDYDVALSEICKRAKQVPGGTCGYWGVCGAAAGAGIFMSVMTGSSPLHKDAWPFPQKLVSIILSRLADVGGPRCCKRTSRIAIEEAVHFYSQFCSVNIPLSSINTAKIIANASRKIVHTILNNRQGSDSMIPRNHCLVTRLPGYSARSSHFTFLQFHERISFSSKTLLIRSSPLSDVKSAVISFFPSTIFTQ